MSWTVAPDSPAWTTVGVTVDCVLVWCFFGGLTTVGGSTMTVASLQNASAVWPSGITSPAWSVPSSQTAGGSTSSLQKSSAV